MLDGLDAIDWAAVDHAYGPAVDVPDWLRALAGADSEARRDAMYWLSASVFHQGTWDASTALVVPFLVELVDAPGVPDKTELLAFLASMTAGHGGDAFHGWDPYVFESTPGPPEYPEAVATLAAIAAGRRGFERALQAPEAGVRAAAAYLLGGMPADSGTADALARQFRGETDSVARASIALALGRQGREVSARDDDDALAAGAVLVGQLWARGEGVDAEAVVGLREVALHGAVEALLWADGQPAKLSIRLLFYWAHPERGGLGAARDALREVLLARLARGERVQPTHAFLPTVFDTLDDEPAEASAAQEPEGEPAHRAVLTALSSALGVLLFPPAEWVLSPADLSAAQREALRWAVDYGLSVPSSGVPFHRPSDVARYLADDGPLARRLTVGGETSPLWLWFHQLTADALNDDAKSAVYEAVGALPASDLLDVVDAILLGQLPSPRGANRCLGNKAFEPLRQHLLARADALAEAVQALAERLMADPDPASDRCLLVAELLQRGAGAWPPEPRWDPLLRRSVYGDRGLAVFAALPRARRPAIAAAVSNGYTFGRLLEHTDPEAVAPLFVRNVAARGWRGRGGDTEQCLTALGPAAIAPLEQAIADGTASGKKLALFERVAAALSGRDVDFSLTVSGQPGAQTLRFELRAPSADAPVDVLDLPNPPKASDYAPVAAALRAAGAVRVAITLVDADALPEGLGYRVMLGLGEHLQGVTLTLGNSRLAVG